jgi:hypothetical protein
VNTHAEYRHHNYRPPEQPAAPESVESAASELARHRDPSLASGPAQQQPRAKRIAWVRPTELASYVGPMVGRGIDLQAELIHRARRTPATATRSLHRPGPSTATTPAPAQEGLGL